jgi:hypothetical protein
LRFVVEGVGFWIKVLGFRVEELRLRVEGCGCRDALVRAEGARGAEREGIAWFMAWGEGLRFDN